MFQTIAANTCHVHQFQVGLHYLTVHMTEQVSTFSVSDLPEFNKLPMLLTTVSEIWLPDPFP